MFGKHHQGDARDLIRDANRKEIQQWSRGGTEILRTFGSVDEASRATGADPGHIPKVCRGERKTAGGYHWKFVNPEDVETKTVLKFARVQQWSFNEKILIQEFDTIKEASEKTGTDRSRIGRCCKGAGRSAGGFKWKVI
jgi:hypothetical protein